MVLRVNLEGAFRLSRSVIKGMMKRRWGRIISVTSVIGTTGNAGRWVSDPVYSSLRSALLDPQRSAHRVTPISRSCGAAT